MNPTGEGAVDAEEFRGNNNNNPLTFQFIVMRQVLRCSELGSTEFRGGFWETSKKTDSDKYVSASHESFSEAVATLYNLLEAYLDDNTKKAVLKPFEDWHSERNNSGKAISLSNYKIERARTARVSFSLLCGYLKSSNYLAGIGAGEGSLDE